MLDSFAERLAELHREIHEIHAANQLYWGHPESRTSSTTAQYKARIDRLEEIRCEQRQLYDERTNRSFISPRKWDFGQASN